MCRQEMSIFLGRMVTEVNKMKTEVAILIIYKAIKNLQSDIAAADYISSVIYNYITKLEEDGTDVTSELIHKKLVEEAKFCIRCETKNVE